MIGCTKNEFIVDDHRLNNGGNSSIGGTTDDEPVYVSFYSSVADYNIDSSPGYSLFKAGNMAQAFVFVTNGNYIDYGNNFYKAYQDGVLTPISNDPFYLTSGNYTFYFTSTNSSNKPPTFYNGISYNTQYNFLGNGVDYLWYGKPANITLNPTVLPVNFQHRAVQLIITVDKDNTTNTPQWTEYAGINAPAIDSTTVWNLYSGLLTPATKLDFSTSLQMNSHGLVSNQFIFPLTGISEIPVYISININGGSQQQAYTLSLPSLSNGEWLAGHSYQYTLKLSQGSLTVQEAVIAPWKEVNEAGELSPIN